MGKAAYRRKERRKKQLARLAQNNPEAFEQQWQRRLLSWAHFIHHNAAKMDKGPVFKVIDEAMEILKACGKEIYEKYSTDISDFLLHQCCKDVASHVDPRLYHITFNYKAMELKKPHPVVNSTRE